MKKYTLISQIIVLCLVIFAIMKFTNTGLSQTQSITEDQPGAIQFSTQTQQNQDPVAEYNPTEPSDPKARDLRRRRNSRFGFGKENFSPAQIEGSRLKEDSPTSSVVYFSDIKPYPAFPISRNTLVVTGTITDARAFLTDDKTGIYSEFTFNIESVLKQLITLNLSNSTSIDLTRRGGKVRLPSGKILNRWTAGYLMPQKGKRYLLFLLEDKESESFEIVTGYELQNGVVIPLDGLVNGDILERFGELYKYKGADENTLVNLARQRIDEINRGGQ